MKKLLALPLFLMLPIALAVYVPGEEANFIVALTDSFGNPIENAACYGFVYFPNMSLYSSFPLSYNNGVYYSSFVIPNAYGTYYEIAICNFTLFEKHKVLIGRKTFQVSSAFDALKKQLESFAQNLTYNVSMKIVMNVTGNVTEAVRNATEELIGLLLALHSTPITEQYCIDNKTLMIVKKSVWTVNNRVYEIVKNETVICEYGCSFKDRECIPHPIYRYGLGIGILILIISVAFFVLRVVV